MKQKLTSLISTFRKSKGRVIETTKPAPKAEAAPPKMELNVLKANARLQELETKLQQYEDMQAEENEAEATSASSPPLPEAASNGKDIIAKFQTIPVAKSSDESIAAEFHSLEGAEQATFYRKNRAAILRAAGLSGSSGTTSTSAKPSYKTALANKAAKTKDSTVYHVRTGETLSKSDYQLCWCGGYPLIGSNSASGYKVLCRNMAYTFETRNENRFQPISREVFDDLVASCLSWEELQLRCQCLPSSQVIGVEDKRQELESAFNQINHNEPVFVRR